MAEVTLEANFNTKDVVDVRSRALAVEQRVVDKMVNAMLGAEAVPGSHVHVRLSADARMIYRAVLAMRAALAEEGVEG